MMQGSLAQRLRVLRARKGLTLTEASKQIGITRHTLAALERGGQEPHYPTLLKISEFYGVPVEELLEEPVLAGKAEVPDTGRERPRSAEARRYWQALERLAEGYGVAVEGLIRVPDVARLIARGAEAPAPGPSWFEAYGDEASLPENLEDFAGEMLWRVRGVVESEQNALDPHYYGPDFDPDLRELCHDFLAELRIAADKFERDLGPLILNSYANRLEKEREGDRRGQDNLRPSL